MKQLYSGALVVLTLSFFSLSTAAQATYTVIQPGNWHTPSGPGIWATVEPPQNCMNCTINVNVQGTVTLNTTINLSNNSLIVIGGGTNVTALTIGNSGSADFANSYSIILANDGTSNKVTMANGSSILNASGAGTYDGLLTSFTSGGSTTYFKQIGNSPNGFVNNTVASNGNASYGTTLIGPSALNSAGTLPIILGAFSAVADNGAVNLAWTTDLEINSDHFTLQASTNAGSNWSTVATIEAAGNSSSPIDYTYTDKKPAEGTTEYRLVLVDRDGRTAYSSVKAVRIGQISQMSVYPNPASEYVNVSLSGAATASANIRLVNLAGQVLLEKNVTNAGGTTVALSVSQLPAGNYLVVVTGAEGTKQVSKVLIAK